MMNFMMITFGVAVGVLVSMVISTILMFAVMSSPKVMGWLMKHYMKMLNKSFENFEKVIDDYEKIEA